MSGNTIAPTGEQNLVDRLLYWTTRSRALLFLLAAIVAEIGIGMIHEGLKGLGDVRQAKAESLEHEKALDAITLAEEQAKNLPAKLDQFQAGFRDRVSRRADR